MEILQKLQEKIGENIQGNIELKQYSTFKLGGPAKYFFIAKSKEEIIKAVQTAKKLDLPFFILGGGSNILVHDNGFDGLVIKVEIKNMEVNGDIIKAEAGVLLGQVVATAMQNGLIGMEWAIGIPGTIGGAVRGNAGAYGSDTSTNVMTTQVYDLEKNIEVKMTKEKCKFEYRESIFKKNPNLIILGAEFQFKQGDKEKIRNQMMAYTKTRIYSQPKFPSVGCSFKNIIVTDEIRKKIKEIDEDGSEAIKTDEKTGISKIGSAWFIDQAGLKGYQIGGAKVSDEHANFIIKVKEDGKADDVVQLISYIKQQVRAKFGIQLQEEVQYVGF